MAAVMEDEAAREQLLSRIRTLIATTGNTEVKPPVESAGARLIAVLSENVEETRREFGAAADALRDVPLIFAWVRDQTANTHAMQMWFILIIKVALVLFTGGVAERLGRLLLKRPWRALEEREADTLWVRLALLAGRMVLDLVTIVAFAVTAYAVAPMVGLPPQAHIVTLTFINAYLIVRITLSVARMLLAPAAKALRVPPLTDVTANYLFIWIWRLVGFSVFGFFFVEAAVLLGLPSGGYTGLHGLLGLAISGLVVVFVMQIVRRWRAGSGAKARLSKSGACAISSPISGTFWRSYT